MQTTTVYHIFSHSIDLFEHDLNTAKSKFNELLNKYGTARLYEEIWDDKDSLDPINEDCLMSEGDFPC